MPASIPRPTGSATTVLRPLWQRLFPDGPSTTELGASPGSAHTSNGPKVGAGQDSNASGWNGGGPGWMRGPQDRTDRQRDPVRGGGVVHEFAEDYAVNASIWSLGKATWALGREHR